MSETVPSSFRDPCGQVFFVDGDVVRTITSVYETQYHAMKANGLLDELHRKKYLIPFMEDPSPRIPEAWKTLTVERLPFISYPYEWSFSRLKAAALLTLKIHMAAMTRGMILKDASAFNVQFKGSDPIFIDCLSFDFLKKGAPWVAYGQFCRHFLAPLLLMAKTDVRANLFLRDFIDGIPLDMVSAMLPIKTYGSPAILMHIHMHARWQKRFADGRKSAAKVKNLKLSDSAPGNLAQGLYQKIKTLRLTGKLTTAWGAYYEDLNYSDAAFKDKADNVATLLQKIAPHCVLDMGANNGFFSRIAAKEARFVIAADMDPLAVEMHTRALAEDPVENILPLVVDLANPSPAIGWNNEERFSFIRRCRADTVMALALIHHLAIGNNLPLTMIADFFSQFGKYLIIEFVPKEDSQVQRMLSTRDDVFPEYTEAAFLNAFSRHFLCEWRHRVADSGRELFLMKKRS